MASPTRCLGLFLRALDNQYQLFQRANFYERAYLYGFSVAEYDANNDASTQQRQITDCLRAPESARPKALFVNPVNEAPLRASARDAARLGIGWVCLNRSCGYVTELRREYPKTPIFCVDPDQRQVGRIQGKQFRAFLPRGGSLFYIHGPSSTSSARLRLAGAEDELASSSIRIVTGGGDWSEESGLEATRGWLQSNRTRNWSECVVGAQNDNMAMGARKAILENSTTTKRPELTTISITGCDGMPASGQRFVLEGLLRATVIIPTTTGTAVNMVVAALDGGQPPVSDVTLSVTSFPEMEALGTRMQGQ